ncbi:hypothetical protein D3C86_1456700 [compost metagenome]
MPGNAWSFGYGRSFDIDVATGDFVIASANNYTAPGYYEVVDGRTFSVIESSSIPGCAIPNKCVVKTYRLPIVDQAQLSDVNGECTVTVTAPTADYGYITATTTDPLTYSTPGTYTITWTYTNETGSVTQTQTVVVEDTTDPVVGQLQAVAVACNETVTAATATDSCAGTITGTTTDPVSYATAGTYTINWTFNDGNGNSVTAQQSVVVSCSSAGLEDLNTAAILVYPVPASNELFIETSLIGETAVVFDVQGQKVLEAGLQTGKTTLDVSALVNGVYFLKTGNSSLRFVISK